MKKYIHVLVFVFIMGLGAPVALAQTPIRITDDNSIGWGMVNANLVLSAKNSVLADVSIRRANGAMQQNQYRVTLNHKVDNNLTVGAGASYIVTAPYGDYPIAANGVNFPERRVFEQAILNTNYARVAIQQRLRLEQRWVARQVAGQGSKQDGWNQLQRVRYLLRTTVPLSQKTMKDGTLYGVVFDEIMIGFGKKVNQNIFDQNRFAALLGYRFNGKISLEAGFFNQILQQGREVNNQEVFQRNRGVMVNMNMTLKVGK